MIMSKNENLPSIVIIEDEPQMMEILMCYIENFIDANFLKASDGDTGLELINNNYENIQLIILDIMLPKKNGFEILKEVRANEKTANLPVIMQSGIVDEQELAEILKNPLTKFMAKPFNITTLEEHLQEFLNKKVA